MKITKDMVGKELSLLSWDREAGKHHILILIPALKQIGKGLYVLPGMRTGFFEDLLRKK